MSPSGQPHAGSAGTLSGGAEFSSWSGSSSILGENDCSESPQSNGDRGNGMASGQCMAGAGGQLQGSSISLWHRPVPRVMIHALRSSGRCCRHVYIYTTGKAMCGLSRTPGRCRNDGKLGSGVSTSSLAAVYEEVWGRLLSWSSVSLSLLGQSLHTPTVHPPAVVLEPRRIQTGSTQLDGSQQHCSGHF